MVPWSIVLDRKALSHGVLRLSDFLICPVCREKGSRTNGLRSAVLACVKSVLMRKDGETPIEEDLSNAAPSFSAWVCRRFFREASVPEFRPESSL